MKVLFNLDHWEILSKYSKYIFADFVVLSNVYLSG